MHTSFFTFFDQYIGAVFARQLLFAQHLQVKEEPVIDLALGKVTFSTGQVYNIELLGTHLEDNTFLWAWSEENELIFKQADFSAPFPKERFESALQLKQWGDDHNVDVFSNPKIVLELSAVPLMPDEFNAEHIACLSAGLKNKAYWRDTHDEGTIYYLVTNTPEEVNTRFSAPHILETIEQVSSYFETDNQAMVESFLQQQGFSTQWITEKVEDDADAQEVSFCLAMRGTEEIKATFDEEGALTEIEAHGFDGEEDYNAVDEDEDEFEDSEFPPKIKQ